MALSLNRQTKEYCQRSELHAKLAVKAEMEGSSLNNWMVMALNKVIEQHA